MRPARDLLAAVPPLPPGDIVDLGCGTGAVGEALRALAPGRRLLGVDASPAMLAEARATGAYDALREADITGWLPDAPPALIFSNAVLHWLPDHGKLLPTLAGSLALGGALAVQMPRQFDAPSHRLIWEVAATLFPERFPAEPPPAPVAPPEALARLVAPLGAADVWETVYLQRLGAEAVGHPVRRFTWSTAARPVLSRLSEDEAGTFAKAYDAALANAYPPEPDGTVLFPFRRVFFVLTRKR